MNHIVIIGFMGSGKYKSRKTAGKRFQSSFCRR